MRVTVNDQPHDVPAETTIIDLLKLAHVPPNYLAVEVNQEVISRAVHETHVLCEGDAVEVVTLVGGG
ncbi:sulfur carrier protein ThiS [Planctomycetaceae bacterium SH139]